MHNFMSLIGFIDIYYLFTAYAKYRIELFKCTVLRLPIFFKKEFMDDIRDLSTK